MLCSTFWTSKNKCKEHAIMQSKRAVIHLKKPLASLPKLFIYSGCVR